MNIQELKNSLDEKEIELVSLTDAEMLKSGVNTYIQKTKMKIYPIARAVADMSPNEKIIFENALMEFREVLSDKK